MNLCFEDLKYKFKNFFIDISNAKNVIWKWFYQYNYYIYLRYSNVYYQIVYIASYRIKVKIKYEDY